MNKTRGGRLRLAAAGLSVSCLAIAPAGAGVLPDAGAQPRQEKAAPLAQGGIGLAGVDDPEAGLLNYKPGFSVLLAKDDLQERIVKFRKHMDEKDWGKAFRLLTELSNAELEGMVPVNNQGLHVAVKQQLTGSLRSLPSDGQQAFRLYFDGEAKELFARIREHPRPGSDEQLELTEAMVDRLLASSLGGEAADLLGDLNFERGRFAQAVLNWKLALEQGDLSPREAFTLQAKIVLAMDRGGDRTAAAARYRELKARYSDTTAVLGGEEVDAIAMLGKSLASVAEQSAPAAADPRDQGPLWIPSPNAMPAWHQQFLSDKNAREITNTHRNRYYYGNSLENLDEMVPAVVADDQRVYFHFMGSIFALNRVTGKILWHTEEVETAAKRMARWNNSNAGDPQNYHIALAKDVLLVTSVQISSNSSREDRIVLTAYDKKNGLPLWSSTTLTQWYIPRRGDSKGGLSIRGEVLVDGPSAYVVFQPHRGSECYLRKFDPATGQIQWTLNLGTSDPITFQYGGDFMRMPQPKLAMYNGDLFVLTNNGAIVAVNTTNARLRWARRTSAPFGVGRIEDKQVQAYQKGDAIDKLDNPNGNGRLIFRNGVLYAKEHNANGFYAIKPETGEQLSEAKKLSGEVIDAKLVGVDDKNFYLMDRSLKAYPLQGGTQASWTNDVDTGQPRNAATIMGKDRLLVYADHGLSLLDLKQKGKPIATYNNKMYLGNKGGRVYRFDDLLICIDQTSITAFRKPAAKP